MDKKEIKKTYLQSSRLLPLTPVQTLFMGLMGLCLTPFYLLLAWIKGVPGLQIRTKCVGLVMRLLFRRRGPIDLKMVFGPLLYPLDSTRHFEVDFTWHAFTAGPI